LFNIFIEYKYGFEKVISFIKNGIVEDNNGNSLGISQLLGESGILSIIKNKNVVN